MASISTLIKAEIKSNLDSLVTSGTLAAVIEQDINTDVLDTEFPAYPL